ncbi:RIP metalloprotease RseP [Desulfuromonas sp. CSMB_57]|jgi:regulator of sigma E protease|uniref:RIP metalloprotease RseP n=1 Tax=Desulfuromonas sp. CSMB_57 TaxID=2807629 RepID=UPI001CD4CF9E|nr:RIP metalloprotease RseP [Desulfuromonas sp. CSMB_57]
MVTILTGILMLGVLIFVHELGHFVVAKLAGVKVLKFSLGFGPRLLSRQWGETVYQICVVPLGGYVQMLGEGSDEAEQLTDPADKERSFAEKKPLQRIAIVAAGPFMNLMLPFLVLPLAYVIGIDMPAFLERPACIGYVAPDTPGARAGFAAGDCVTRIDDQSIASWSEAEKELLRRAGREVMVTVERSQGPATIRLTGNGDVAGGLQAFGLLPPQDAVIGQVLPGLPAAEAGLQAGDRILAIGEAPVDSWYMVRPLVAAGAGETLTLRIGRQDQTLSIPVTPRESHEGDGWLLGVAPEFETVFKRFPLAASWREGSRRSIELMRLTVVFVGKLFSGSVSPKSIGGPIQVVQVAGAAADTGFTAVLSFLAFLSIQLGILNLLPVPILDGGHLLFGFLELIFRRPLPLRVREVAQQIGLGLIILLMAWAFYNDLARLLMGRG